MQEQHSRYGIVSNEIFSQQKDFKTIVTGALEIHSGSVWGKTHLFSFGAFQSACDCGCTKFGTTFCMEGWFLPSKNDKKMGNYNLCGLCVPVQHPRMWHFQSCPSRGGLLSCTMELEPWGVVSQLYPDVSPVCCVES